MQRNRLSAACEAVACCVVIGLGALVMLGWHRGWATVVQVYPTLAPMQFNTALGFFLSGIAALSLFVGRPRLAASAVSFAGLLGVATLLEYASGWSLGIDELFAEHSITVETSHPGRMAPNTAIGFALFCLSVLAACKWKKQMSVTAVTAAVVLTLGVSALIGYAGNLHAAYGWGELTNMALHTACGFTVLSSVLLGWAGRQETSKLTFRLLVLSSVGGTLLTLFLLQAVMATLGVHEGNPTTTILLIAGLASVIFCITIIEALQGVRRAYTESERYAKSLERKTTELEDFVRVASHDLKSPLRAVRLMSQWAKESLETDAEGNPVEYLERINQSASNMASLIDDLLSYAHADDIEAKLDWLDSESLLEAALFVSGIPDSMRVETEGAFGKVQTFATPLRTCLRNLLSNAAKHHDRETGRIVVRFSETYTRLLIEVEDDGPGIPPEHHERIFLMFEKLGHTRGVQSTGLGLSFIKKTVDVYGGTISVSSNGERGSVFTLNWPKPIAADDEEKHAPGSKRESAPAGELSPVVSA